MSNDTEYREVANPLDMISEEFPELSDGDAVYNIYVAWDDDDAGITNIKIVIERLED